MLGAQETMAVANIALGLFYCCFLRALDLFAANYQCFKTDFITAIYVYVYDIF